MIYERQTVGGHRVLVMTSEITPLSDRVGYTTKIEGFLEGHLDYLCKWVNDRLIFVTDIKDKRQFLTAPHQPWPLLFQSPTNLHLAPITVAVRVIGNVCECGGEKHGWPHSDWCKRFVP